jgi:hypothetical protein
MAPTTAKPAAQRAARSALIARATATSIGFFFDRTGSSGGLSPGIRKGFSTPEKYTDSSYGHSGT